MTSAREPSPTEVASLRRRLACAAEFLGHDLSNQFVAVQGLLSLISLSQSESPDLGNAEFLLRAQTSLRRAADRTQIVRRIARIGTEKDRTDSVKVGECAQEAAAATQLLFPRLRMSYDIPAVMPDLLGDATELTAVFQELFANAARVAKEIAQLKFVVQAELSEEELILTVCDNGIGLEPSRLDRLNSFFADDSPTGFERGLGLLMVRETLFLWGGRISARASGTEGGLVFSLVLPRRLLHPSCQP